MLTNSRLRKIMNAKERLKPSIEKTLTNHLDIMFAGCIDTQEMMRVEHSVKETTCGEIGEPSKPAVLITSRGITGTWGEKREYRIQRTIVLDSRIKIPHNKMIQEAKAGNAAELWAIAFSSR